MYNVLKKFTMDEIREFGLQERELNVCKEPIALNLEKWDVGTPLFVTGQGGSGKTTVARELGELFHAVVISTDTLLNRLQWTKERFDRRGTNRLDEMDVLFHPVVMEYINYRTDLPYATRVGHKIVPKYIDRIDRFRFEDFIDWVIGQDNKLREEWYTKRVIVEGTGILYAPGKLKWYPMIIMNTGAVRSFLNRIKRQHERGIGWLMSGFNVAKDYVTFEYYFDDLLEDFVNYVYRSL